MGTSLLAGVTFQQNTANTQTVNTNSNNRLKIELMLPVFTEKCQKYKQRPSFRLKVTIRFFSTVNKFLIKIFVENLFLQLIQTIAF